MERGNLDNTIYYGAINVNIGNGNDTISRTTGLDLDNCCFKPINWCISQWKELTSPLERGKSAAAEVVKRFFLFLPLLLLTLCTCVVALPGLLVWKTTISKTDNQPQHIEGSRNVGTRRVSLSDSSFQQLQLNGPEIVRVVITEGEQYVTITGDDNLLDYFVPKEEGKRLFFGCKEELSISSSNSIVYEVHISYQELNRVFLEGSGSISIDQLNAKEFTCQITGSGEIQIKSGRARNQTILIAGSGDYKGSQLVTENSFVTIAGSGDAEVNTKNLKVEITGSGFCHYSGSPKITKTILGSGDVLPLGSDEV
jgi:hypothetical protein